MKDINETHFFIGFILLSSGTPYSSCCFVGLKYSSNLTGSCTEENFHCHQPLIKQNVHYSFDSYYDHGQSHHPNYIFSSFACPCFFHGFIWSIAHHKGHWGWSDWLSSLVWHQQQNPLFESIIHYLAWRQLYILTHALSIYIQLHPLLLVHLKLRIWLRYSYMIITLWDMQTHMVFQYLITFHIYIYMIKL